MFRCDFCNKTATAKTSCKKLTVTRMYQHPFRPRVQKRWGVDKSGKKKLEWRDDPGGMGSQIVAEYAACPDCALKEGVA